MGDVEAQASEGQGAATGSGSTEKRNAVGATRLSRFGLFPTRTFTDSEIAVPVPGQHEPGTVGQGVRAAGLGCLFYHPKAAPLAWRLPGSLR